MKPRKIIVLLLSGLIISLLPSILMAGFGDVVVKGNKKTSTQEDVKDVVFPHWIHRIRYKCKLCHEEIFEIEAGKNATTMKKIVGGESCGTCHNGEISWDVEKCELCHSQEPIDWNSNKESRWQSLQKTKWRELRSLK